MTEFDDLQWPEEEEEVPKPRGVLSYAPRYSSLFSLACIYFLIATCSIAYWRGYDFLATSYQTAFIDWQLYTLLSSLFVHADFPHILANSPMLIIFGYYLQGYFSWRTFPLACVILGVITNIFTLHFMANETRLIGASGMVYAMVGLWLVYYIRFENRYSVLIRVIRAIGFALVVMFPSVYQKNVSYYAHGFGFAFGLTYGLITCYFIWPQIDAEAGETPEGPGQPIHIAHEAKDREADKNN